MVRRFSLTALAIVVTLAIPVALFAQDTTATTKHLREGFWLRFGVGYGTADGSTSGIIEEDLDSDQGPSGFLALGGQLSPIFGLGGGSFAITNSEDDQDAVYGLVAPTLVITPSPTTGFYLQTSIGFLVYRERGPFMDVDGIGWGIGLGAGYDVRVARMLSISPYANFMYGRTGDLEVDGTSVDLQLNGYIFQGGFSLTVH